MTEKTETELKEGFYWNRSFYGNIHLVYYSGHVDPDDENIIFASLFDDRGKYGTIVTEIDRLTIFDPEKDMVRLKPKVAERVREKLEELANQANQVR